MMHIVRIPQTQQTKSKMLSPKYIYWSQFEQKLFIVCIRKITRQHEREEADREEGCKQE